METVSFAVTVSTTGVWRRHQRRYVIAADDVKSIDYVAEAEPDSQLHRLELGQLTCIRPATRVEEATSLESALLISQPKVGAEVRREGCSQLLQDQKLIGSRSEFKERTPQGEPVGCDVSTEQNDATPVIQRMRCVRNEGLSQG